jgi:gtrA family protein
VKFIDIKLLKFIIVGVINTGVGAGTMFILYNVVHLSYWISSICNYIVGGALSFVLNKYFTFGNTQKSLKQIIIYILNLVACYAIAYILAKHLVYMLFITVSKSFKDNIAMMCGMCLYTTLNYFLQRYIVFKEN